METLDTTAVKAAEVKVYKGRAIFTEENNGAHYYAFSPQTTLYSEVFANIVLPTVKNLGIRNGYVSLGIHGDVHGIDLGLKNAGDGWYPYSWDCHEDNSWNEYPAYIAPSTATNAIMVVKPVNETTVHMYVQFTDASGKYVGTPFDQDISVARGNLSYKNGIINCAYYRFASLVPKGTDNRKDGTYMKGGKFTNLRIYVRASKKYIDWGIPTDTIANVWAVYPKNVSLSYTNTSDTFSIEHLYG